MSETFAIATFLARWSRAARHDLSGSDSETLSLGALLGLAEKDDLDRWAGLGFGYADPRGAPWLRDAIARRHTEVSSDDVLCCAGAQEALACAVKALVEPGDHAIVVLPIYQPSEHAVTDLCAATGVPLSSTDWQLDVDAVAAAIRPNTRLVLTNFPNSPTGAVLDPGTFAALVALCRRHGLWLVNDEVYAQSGSPDAGQGVAPVVDAYERGISVNGLSKGFGLPGLRVGWVACRDEDVLGRALQAKCHLSSCVSSASEVLAHVALRAEATILTRTREVGQRNRGLLATALSARPDLFGSEASRMLSFAFPRYLGKDGSDGCAARLVRDASLMVLPSTLWRSALGPTPVDHVRIGLGHVRSAAGLDTLGGFLAVAQAA